MARLPRELSRSNYFHILIQGNNQNKIFFYDEDKEQLLEIVKNSIDNDKTQLIAYCIMDKHAHLIIYEEKNISEIMKKINLSYAIYFNKKYNTTGHVFADRFKSECISNIKELLPVIRYVHKHPIEKSGATLDLFEYKWSSYYEYIQRNNDTIIYKECILEQFDGEYEKAVKKFIDYTNSDANDIYLDISGIIESKMISLVNRYLRRNNINLEELGYKENREHQIILVILLKDKGNLSIRKIGEILKLNRGIVYRILNQYFKD